MNLTLQQLFGSGASQTSTALVIQKSDLSGLSASSANTAESLLVAILLLAQRQFQGELTAPDGSIIRSPGNEPITYSQSRLYEKLNVFRWARQFIRTNIIDTMVIEVFVKPPTEYGTPLTGDLLDNAN